MTALSMLSQAYFMFQIQNAWLIWVAVGLTLGIEIYIFCCDGGRTYPANMVLLGIFTLCEGYIVSFISSATGYQQGNGVVMLAAFLTLGSLTLIQLWLWLALYTPATRRKIIRQVHWW